MARCFAYFEFTLFYLRLVSTLGGGGGGGNSRRICFLRCSINDFKSFNISIANISRERSDTKLRSLTQIGNQALSRQP